MFNPTLFLSSFFIQNLFHSGSHFTRVSSQNDYVEKKSEYQRNFCSPLPEKNVSSNASTTESEDSYAKKVKHPLRSKSGNSKRSERVDALAKSVSTENVRPRKKTSSQPVKNKEKDVKEKISPQPVKTIETSGPTSPRRTEDSDKTEPKHKVSC